MDTAAMDQNSLYINLLDTWRWLMHIHIPTGQIISFFLHRPCFSAPVSLLLLCSGPPPICQPLYSRAVLSNRVLLLESPPGQVQRIIPSGALSKWCCIRSPWAPCTLFAAVSQCLSAEYSHCKICFCIWCSGFVTPVLCRDSPGLHYKGKCLISLREWNCEQRWNLAQMKPCLSVPTNRCLPVSRVS